MAQVYEENVIKAIQDGNLEALKKCWISKSDINQPLSCSRDYKVINNSNFYPFPRIKNPTLVVFAILCEQPDILLYLCTSKSPNLSQKVNGWAPIHYAACTKDYHCLKVLLKFQYIQEDIDLPVSEPFNAIPGRYTTALHISVTNRRHAQTILLTQNLTKIEYDGDNNKIESEELYEFYPPAKIHQMSAFGNLPLHIAVRQNDLKLCQILLAANNDLSIVNDKNQTPLDIARQFKRKELLNQIQLNLTPSISLLEKEFLSDESSDEEELDSENTENDQKYDEMKGTIAELNHTIEELKAKLAYYEKTPENTTKVISDSSQIKCIKCSATTNTVCPICHLPCCDVCLPKHYVTH